jgi:hypothetical protein
MLPSKAGSHLEDTTSFFAKGGKRAIWFEFLGRFQLPETCTVM